ncbi:helix-turn-helix transcriptional regulator [Vibrio sp. S4M6]|uniref:helix-turn-helix domain-containing protein n=1 Tax=Vibrio sinus TaxID=2946865 RepID=UPI002029F40E|nr:helix-turn-helix transcriptional regulator [Vibrio sinus]MCL9779953.1 helix-turn-helix transcriptional regulator [Vibrio sinus]
MSEQLHKEICRLVKQELRKNNISYRDLAVQLDISEVSVKRLLNNVQPLSLDRLIRISVLCDIPISSLITQAEKNIAMVPVFTHEQDKAFADCPALYTLWFRLSEHLSVEQIIDTYHLDVASMHIYLRKLESVGLIELGINNKAKLCVPSHTAFKKGAVYPSAYKNQVLTRLKDRVVNLQENDTKACMMTLKIELTEREFTELAIQLDEWMFNKLSDSKRLPEQARQKTRPYTLAFMAAQGSFYDELPDIPRCSLIRNKIEVNDK